MNTAIWILLVLSVTIQSATKQKRNLGYGKRRNPERG